MHGPFPIHGTKVDSVRLSCNIGKLDDELRSHGGLEHRCSHTAQRLHARWSPPSETPTSSGKGGLILGENRSLILVRAEEDALSRRLTELREFPSLSAAVEDGVAENALAEAELVAEYQQEYIALGCCEAPNMPECAASEYSALVATEADSGAGLLQVK